MKIKLEVTLEKMEGSLLNLTGRPDLDLIREILIGELEGLKLWKDGYIVTEVVVL